MYALTSNMKNYRKKISRVKRILTKIDFTANELKLSRLSSEKRSIIKEGIERHSIEFYNEKPFEIRSLFTFPTWILTWKHDAEKRSPEKKKIYEKIISFYMKLNLKQAFLIFNPSSLTLRKLFGLFTKYSTVSIISIQFLENFTLIRMPFVFQNYRETTVTSDIFLVINVGLIPTWRRKAATTI